MKPTEELIAEHNAVLLALQILEKVGEAVATGSKDAALHLGELIEFLKGFVDRCHHGKEEDVLFPELRKHGVPQEGGPIGVMLAEHEVGRQHVREMSDALARLHTGDPGAVRRIRAEVAGYCNLLRGHIFKENNVLFLMADEILPEAVAVDVVERFEEIERVRVGEGKHEAYHALLHRLRDRYGVR